MLKRIGLSFILIGSFSYALSVPDIETQAPSEVNSTAKTEEVSKDKIDLNSKIVATDWLSWIEEFGRIKNIDRITKKKIYKGAEIVADFISKKRSTEINEKIIEMDDTLATTSTEWKLKEQEVTMKKIGKKLSSMTLKEIIDVYNKYAKKEKTIKKSSDSGGK